ncbi:hypothetical protein AB0896_23670 [Streptomyces parvulus]|uniref:hypothetical protein n=1 Tax=Streptomyces parvulus TaxID=146923 RepID=UPI003452DC5A
MGALEGPQGQRSTEFTIQAPESALQYAQPVGEPPGVSKPAAGALAGPVVKFSGVAPPGTDYVPFFEQGRYVGGAGRWTWRRPVNWEAGEHALNENGEWAFSHAHPRRPGTHTVGAIALFGATESAPTTATFKVVGIPENSPIRSFGASRHACGDVCEHRPFTGDW